MSKKNDVNRKELIFILQNFYNLRTGQDQVLWNIFGAFWATNALLLINFFAANEKWTIFQVGIFISPVGFVFSVIWEIIQTRAIGRIKKYESSIKSIEGKLFPDNEELCAFHESSVLKDQGIMARDLMKISCIVIIICWFISMVTFIVLNFDCFRLEKICLIMR